MAYVISYACITHRGKLRKKNQDNFVCDGRYLQTNIMDMSFPLCGSCSLKHRPIFGIFDGMGGAECGEIAALLAARKAATLRTNRDAGDTLAQFCQDANREICDYADHHGVFTMGTTAALLFFHGKHVTLCNIGDSKIYRFSKGALVQLSQDHLVPCPFGLKPSLSQNLGIPQEEMIIEPYVVQVSYQYGDRYLICSDGLTDMVSVTELENSLNCSALSESVVSLLNKALVAGGRDNITIILCQIHQKPTRLFGKRHNSV